MTIKTKPNSSINYGARTIRGGRLTKWKGTAASIAPVIGAIAGITLSAPAALADCTGTGGNYTCSGTTSTVQSLTGTTLNVTTSDTGGQFSLHASNGGFNLKNPKGALTLEADNGILFIHQGNGTIGDALNGPGGGAPGNGIVTFNKSSGLTKIELEGDVVTSGIGGIIVKSVATTTVNNGVSTETVAHNQGSINIVTKNVSGRLHGIDLQEVEGTGTDTINIRTTGAVTGTGGTGLRMHARNGFSTADIVTEGEVSGGKNGVEVIVGTEKTRQTQRI